MYKEATVIDKKKVIAQVLKFIQNGRVKIRNNSDALIYDVYGQNPKRPFISFQNKWAAGEFILYIDGRVADGFNYAKSPNTMPECQDLMRVQAACVKRCDELGETTFQGNDTSMRIIGKDVVKTKQNFFGRLFGR